MAVVIVNRHEPEHEVADRLLELTEEKGYNVRDVEAVRGDHNAALSFRVPDEVAEDFEKDRSKRWAKIENDGEEGVEPATVDGDAVAATNQQTAENARTTNAENAEKAAAKKDAAKTNAKSRE